MKPLGSVFIILASAYDRKRERDPREERDARSVRCDWHGSGRNQGLQLSPAAIAGETPTRLPMPNRGFLD
jgi:hypothetical protein